LEFDGTEGYVEVPDSDNYEFAGDFSIAFWLKSEMPAPGSLGIVTKGYHDKSNTKPWYLVYFVPAGSVDLYLRTKDNKNSRAKGAIKVNDGKWHHIVTMKRGKKFQVYVDGKKDGEADAVDAKYGESDLPLVFMTHYFRYVKGALDEVVIFNKALSEGEISDLMKGFQSGTAVEANVKLPTIWSRIKNQ